MEQTQVKTRSNTLEPVSFDKITARLSSICSWQLDFKSMPNMFSIDWCAPIKSVDPISISKKICARIYHGIPTSELDAMSAELCAAMAINNPDYGKLASRIVVSNNQKVTPDNLTDVIKLSEENTDANGNKSPLYHPDVAAFITKWADILDDMICYDRDYDIDFFGFKTLSRSYLLKSNGSIIERPQHLWMRVAVFLHAPYSQKIYIDAGDQESGDQESGDQESGDQESGDQESGDQNTHEFIRMMLQPYFDKIKETYDALSCKEFIHATPTLFHAGTPRPQCSSCFLMGTEDSVEGIYKTISDAAMISKWAGGIGLHISNIRANGSYIRKTAGRSLGIMPMLKVYNDTARYINQSGRRNGSFALYIEPWHADIFDFLDAKKNQGAEEARARDLFYALWIPDLFMQRVRDDLNWCLMCPDESPGLCDCYGEEFETLYKSYESSGKYRKELKAREIWKAIINSQIETGTPYMLYKDAANSCSNQQNIGMIKSSNLCSEIIEYSDSKEYAVCNLASVNLTQHVKPNNKGIDEISRWQNIVIITIDNCQWCRLLKALLNKYSIKYTEYKLTRDKENNIEWNGIGGNLMKQYDLKKVPQLFYNVDYHDCHDLEQKGIINNLDQNQDLDPDHSTDLDEIKHIGGYDAVWNRIKPIFDYEGLYKNTQIITRNLNKIIDLNYYPVEETRISNLRHRPIGIGVQGLADVFQLLRLPFGSHESRVLNAGIHETISYAALSESCNLAETTKPYETYEGSPLSRGLFQFDLWEKRGQKREIQSLGLWNWDELRERIIKHGVRNSLLLAPMPTASTSQILGNNECFEPYTANVYTRRVLAGEFTVINRHLVNDLQCLDIQDDDMSSELVQYRGSVQNIDRIPGYFKDIYKTSWELKQKILIDMARDRGFYICQSQSLNLFFERPDYETLSKAHIYSWKSGLKTGSYYIRSKPALASQQFTVAVKKDSSTSQSSHEPCEMCSA